MATKAKVTVTLDEKLLAAVDAMIGNGHRSRSAAFEDIVRQWKRQRDREQEAREIEEYYRTMSKEEREEDRRWAEFSSLCAAKVWGPADEWKEEWERFRKEAKSTTSSSRRKKTHGRR